MFALRDDVECLVYCTGFCYEDGAIHWKSFLENCLIQNCCTCCFVDILGAIREDTSVVGMVF